MGAFRLLEFVSDESGLSRQIGDWGFEKGRRLLQGTTSVHRALAVSSSCFGDIFSFASPAPLCCTASHLSCLCVADIGSIDEL